MKKIPPEDLKGALEKSWSKETSADPENWTPDNPAWGQCAITALIVQDFFGGKLIRAAVNELGVRSHYWNQLSDGREIDLTKGQFPKDFYERIKKHSPKETRSRKYVLSYPETAKRYKLLKGRVNEFLKIREARNEEKESIFDLSGKEYFQGGAEKNK